ncbi:MAG: Gldg family protein, partial [Lachnospiraceae bacterium]|nr:Gldg family protein [Lachnospiraceae bacterium]
MKPVKNWLRKTPDVKGSFKSKSFRVGSYSMAATAIVIAIAIVINLFVAEIPSKYTIFDTTSTQLFSISDQTETIVENLDMDITIYWIVQDGYEDSTIQTLLEQYEGMSNKVKVVKRDPDVYPTFVQQYASELRYNNSLVVESELRYVFVDYDEIYLYEYSYSDDYYYTGNYEETVSFNGEGALTKAIDYVISEDIPKIYHLTGHGETSLSTTYTEAIAKENVELEELILLNQEAVPEDADCILIHAPQSDIADEEKEMLLAYLQAGGKMLLISGISQGKKETPNLDAL